MFDKNLVVSYCQSKIEETCIESEELSKKASASISDAIKSSYLLGKVTAYKSIAIFTEQKVTNQSELAEHILQEMYRIKESSKSNSTQKPSIELVLKGELLLGQADAFSDISDRLSRKFFEK